MPVHAPRSTLSVWPSSVVPVTCGGVVLAGGSATMRELGVDVDVSLPATLVAVTSMRMVDPMSAAVRS